MIEVVDAQRWDDMYRSRDQVFSGNPNGVLVAEAGDLPPGRALDVGCGEGGDAFWLAGLGWQVTAIDISQVALERAAAHDVTGQVAWVRTDLATDALPGGDFDLVSVQYFPLRRTADHVALTRLLDAVRPGGTLLFATHALADLTARPDQGFDPAEYYQPDEIAALLADDTWSVQVDETRPRTAPAPEGTHHSRDAVLRARRRPVSSSGSRPEPAASC